MIHEISANGCDESLDKLGVIRATRGITSSHKLQLRQHRFIQQINPLLEPFILHECGICLLSSSDRSISKQMFNVSDSSTVGSNHLDQLSAFLRFMVW